MDNSAFFSPTRPQLPGQPCSSSLRCFTTVFLLILTLTGLARCSTASSKLEAKYKVGVPVSRVFYAKYDEVETALKQAMIRYPQRIDNSDAGIFETDYLKGEARFRPPQAEKDYSSGYKYRILIRVVRGKSDLKPGVAGTKVQVLKQAELARDFFSAPEPQPSDGLEEEAILYRIGRELNIAKAIQKSSEAPTRQMH